MPSALIYSLNWTFNKTSRADVEAHLHQQKAKINLLFSFFYLNISFLGRLRWRQITQMKQPIVKQGTKSSLDVVISHFQPLRLDRLFLSRFRVLSDWRRNNGCRFWCTLNRVRLLSNDFQTFQRHNIFVKEWAWVSSYHIITWTQHTKQISSLLQSSINRLYCKGSRAIFTGWVTSNYRIEMFSLDRTETHFSSS